MSTTTVNIAGAPYEVPTPIAKWMGDYYKLYTDATDRYNKLVQAADKVRKLQKQCLTSRSPDIMRACKVAERELDELLRPPGQKPVEVQQPEQPQLF